MGMSTHGTGEAEPNPIVDLDQKRVPATAQQASQARDYDQELDEEIDELIADLRGYMGKRV